MADLHADVQHVDVLIVGGGPVGLITAYQLARTLPGPMTSRIKIIEKHAKSAQDAYGRAITLFPRTSEMLDQMGLADALAQQCFACRETASYDCRGGGEEVREGGRGAWAFMEEMAKDSAWGFSLVLRQKYQERIFRAALRRLGVVLDAPVELMGLEIDEAVAPGGYRVTAALKDGATGQSYAVKCRYLVGADGGRSTVRRALDIPFDGHSSEDKWVRIDGEVRTNLPKPRSYAAIESPTHGNVLWAALDHGATRIGFAFTAARQEKYAVFDEAAAVQEAIAAVAPFSLSFTRVDWWTIYVVGQRVARRFSTPDHSVFLAGDSCHTHSSGAAQGMNTGIHDAVNLGWKLSLVLRGLADPAALLPTYERERRPNVQKLIAYDKAIARLMTMQLPEDWTGDPHADPNAVLGDVMASAATFSSGLGISYDADAASLLSVHHHPASLPPTPAPSVPSHLIPPGHRAPDAPLRKPGSLEPTRLHRETPNLALFHVVAFVGDPAATAPALRAFRAALDTRPLFRRPDLPVRYVTVSAAAGPSVFEVLGGRPALGSEDADDEEGDGDWEGRGRAFFDVEDAGGPVAHRRFGVDVARGAVTTAPPFTMHFPPTTALILLLLPLAQGGLAYSWSNGNENCAPGGARACAAKGQHCVVATDTGYAEVCAVSCAAASTCAATCRSKGKTAHCVVDGNWACVCT
ncbi:pentachlorophenol 4-monooxygenase [Neofusicoccum parvum]|uniref:Pentachlorophenol 4-monooxygenase n=1 Tax=Neofusicoccum parvum TaxID=310453 RepID=A0ACB5SGU6_9PEZI|nr:pentachlorophenol 4-monooxygenase [Neofusicoccum parvum]